MHGNNLKRLDDLSAEQTVIGLFLQDKDFKSSAANYILGTIGIGELSQALSTTFRNVITNGKMVDLPISLIDALKHTFTQEGSFFHVLKQVVQILNKNGKQRVNRDNVNRYLEVYETTMEKVGQFRAT